MARTITHLASQICCDIWLFKKRKEAQLAKSLTYAEVAEYYSQSLDGCDGDDEPRSDPRNVERAIFVYDKILSNKVAAGCISWTEDKFESESPFNSIQKLQEISAKCKKVSALEWFFQLCVEGLEAEHLEVADMSTRKLKGSSGQIGLLDIVLMKRSMKDFLLGRFLDQRNCDSNHKVEMRKIFASPRTYRSLYLASRFAILLFVSIFHMYI